MSSNEIEKENKRSFDFHLMYNRVWIIVNWTITFIRLIEMCINFEKK
jgi:acyl-ACP thioesterase